MLASPTLFCSPRVAAPAVSPGWATEVTNTAGPLPAARASKLPSDVAPGSTAKMPLFVNVPEQRIVVPAGTVNVWAGLMTMLRVQFTGGVALQL
jgi:hypothetical protein